MPRKRPIPEEAALELPGGHLRHRGAGRPTKVESEDPRLPMEQSRVAEPHRPSTTEQRTTQRLFVSYARNLVSEQGNVPRALALTLGRDPDDNPLSDDELVREHDRIRGAGRSFSTVSEIIELNDAGLAVRVATLVDLMHSNVPAARVAAVRELTEIDETAKAQRIGGTWEEFVRTARAKAALKGA